MSTLLTIRVALRALGANKLRTALTTLGIVIGVGAVVALMSVGAGSQAQVTAQIQGLGTNLLFVRPGSRVVGGVQTGAGGAATLTLTDADAEALAQLPAVVDAAPELMGFGQVVGEGQNWNTRLLGVTQVSTINVQVADQALIDQAVAEIGDVLRTRHRVDTDDFTIQSQQEFLEAFNQILGTFTLLLGAIAGISLVVGGIGIMNIMLVSVTERTHEIGIRKAVGARHRDILAQFIVESITVSVLGGMLGIAAGSAVASLLSSVRLPSASGAAPTTLQTLVTVDSLLLAFGVSVAVGLFFGIYPANRAATLNPIDALRSE